MALAKVLKTNTTLTVLNLCGNGIGPSLPQALSKHKTLNCLCFEVVTAPPLVDHDPWTTSHTQMNIKKSKLKVAPQHMPSELRTIFILCLPTR